MPSDTPNVNSAFFEGQYKDLWRLFIPEELTRKELDFITSYFNLQPGSKILDIMCGYGRHSIGLARKGMNVTAIDNLNDYIEEIKKVGLAENLSLQTIQSDVLGFQASSRFDLALCMGNSLNFFNEGESIKLMKMVADSLHNSGHFLINTWSLAETVIKNFAEKSWSYEGNYKVLNDSVYLFNPTRIETEFIMIDEKGNTEVKQAIDYIFSYSEMQKMLNEAGFEIEKVYSIPGKKEFTVGEPRAYIVAKKV
ncbi:MAG: class I SAM-dependent methyltransferase [Bacteroidetes bacterium]|nr:class I SAM-dependent methyltransferase [Bacteroidota bacterium]